MGATGFADGSDASVGFSVPVAVDSLKPDMSKPQAGEGGRAKECLFSAVTCPQNLL